MVEILWEMIDEMEIKDYQTIDVVTAKSSYAEPRLNTAIWPGYNASILIQEKDHTKVQTLINEIKEMNKKAFNSAEIVAVHSWSLDA